MKLKATLCAAVLVASCSRTTDEPAAKPSSPTAIAPASTEAPGGAYTLDPTHSSLIFKVDHLGLSNYTARFKRFDADLQFDPKQPERSTLTATVDASSLETDFPAGGLDFNGMLEGPEWLGAGQFPQITYRSRKVTLTGPQTARIEGDLTMKGITRPLTLEARFNGGFAPGLDPQGSRIGFSATGALNRSEFGVKSGIPAEGKKIGVSDKVDIIIETEFVQPAPKPPAS